MQRSHASMATPQASDHVARHLDREKVVWLGTTGARGEPHLVPIWFLWDGAAFLVFSKPDARKVRNLRANPDVMLALGDAAADFDVQLVHARAELLDTPTAEILPRAMLAKYRRQMRSLGLGADEYARTYSQPIRIMPTRFLEWHGRSHLAGNARNPMRLRATAGVAGLASFAKLRGMPTRWRPPAMPTDMPFAVLIGGTAWAPLQSPTAPTQV